MKRFLAIAACLAINSLTVHHLFAQRATPRTRTVAIHRGGGYLGVGVAEIDEERAKALNVKEARGVEIKMVEPDSPAAKAGVKVGDVLLEYNGQVVEGAEQFMRLVNETPPGHKATLQIMRNGAEQRLTTVVAPRAASAFGGGDLDIQIPEMPELNAMPEIPAVPALPRFEMPGFVFAQSVTIGIEAEALSPQLAEYFGVKDGVLVRSVAPNSPAEKAGLKAGDVVTKVNGVPVTTAREISSQVRGARAQPSVAFSLIRNHKELALNVKPSNAWQHDDREQH